MNFPLAVLGWFYWVCSGYATAIILWRMDSCFMLMIIQGGQKRAFIHRSKNQTKISPNKMYDWIVLVKYWSLFICRGVYLSDMSLTVQVQSCVPCSSDIRQSPAQREAQLWDKEAAYQQKYQLLHTASWSLMGLLWQRDAQDERLVSSITVKPLSQPLSSLF